MQQNDYDIIRNFLDACEAEVQQEAEQLEAKAKTEPTEHNKKVALGARWTTYHLREIKKRLEKKAG